MIKNTTILILSLLLLTSVYFLFFDKTIFKSELQNKESKVNVGENKNSLDKAIESINNSIKNGSEKDVGESSYTNGYVYHYFGYFEGRSLIVASVNDSTKRHGKRWDLILLEKNNQQTVLYSGLLTDCCGGGIPEIRTNAFSAEIHSGSGDLGGSSSESIYINIRDAPKEFAKISTSFSATDFSGSFSFSNSSNENFSIKPIISGSCNENNKGSKITLSGFTAKSGEIDFTKNLENPIEVICKVGGEAAFNSFYSKSVSFGDVQVANKRAILFTVNIYDTDTKKTEIIPMTFYMSNGFQ